MDARLAFLEAKADLLPDHLVDALEEARWAWTEARRTWVPWRRWGLRRQAKALVAQIEAAPIPPAAPRAAAPHDPAFA